jgi:glycosyltransferase involved in cell wall biosynthesis
LRIGIDARAAVEVGAGRGRVVRELLRGLAQQQDEHSYLCFARTPWPQQLDERFQWRIVDGADPLWHFRAARAASRECDVYLSSNSYLTPLFMRIPAVVIVYDLVTFEPDMRPNLRSTLIERATLGLCSRRAEGLVAISQATADALAARFPAAKAKTTVALLGTSPALAPEAQSEEGPSPPPPGFVLAVGTLEPRKNLPRLVQAYSSLERDLQDHHPLVVVGALGWETSETLAALQGLGERAVMLGRVSDATLAELYRRCALFCYPSLGEGFGLPVLEAMAAGAPVLTADNTSLPEVGGDAVEYCDARSVQSIAAGLGRLLASPERRAELVLRGRARAQGFSWERFAELTLRALEQAGSTR